jgi:diguanylate cyclase (GGDEF)-like protein
MDTVETGRTPYLGPEETPADRYGRASQTSTPGDSQTSRDPRHGVSPFYVAVLARAFHGGGIGMAEFDPAIWAMVGQRRPVADMARQLQVSEAEVRRLVSNLLLDAAAFYHEVWMVAEHPPWSPWHDYVTGVGNRAAAERYLSWSLEVASRYGRKVSVVFADVDGLKAVNDRDGHAAGDRLLRRTAQTLVRCARQYDRVFRWGGDEFLLVLPRADLAAASGLIRHVRRTAPDLRFSAGVAEWSVGETPELLVERADRAMYADKASRRPRPALTRSPD